MKAEEEARIAEEATLKVEEHQRAQLKVDEGVHLFLEAIQREEDQKEDHQHARLKAEEEARIFEKSRLKSEEEYLQLKTEYEAHLIE